MVKCSSKNQQQQQFKNGESTGYGHQKKLRLYFIHLSKMFQGTGGTIIN
jgi:hypothetical protein